MGTWGVAISSDDLVMDIQGQIVELLKKDIALSKACEKVIKQYKNLDREEKPLLWLAIASMQWKYGEVSNEILENVRSDIANERGLEIWREDSKLLGKRKKVLHKFLAKIEVPNPKPSKRPKLIIRKAPYKKGDCISVSVGENLYTAAIVLAVDNSNKENGSTLVGCLDYLSETPPSLEDFKRKNWLKRSYIGGTIINDITWYLSPGFKKEKKRFELIGNIKIGWFKPKHENLYTFWQNLGST